MNLKLKRLMAVIFVMAVVLNLYACGNSTSTTEEDTQTATDAGSSAAEGAGSGETVFSGPGEGYTGLKVSDNLKVGYVIMDVKADSQIRSMWQAKIECAHRGWEFIDASCEGDDYTNDAIRNLINQDVDVIVLGNMSLMEAKTDIIAEARAKGIGVYCNDNQVVDGVLAGSTMANGVAAMELFYQVANDHDWNLNMCITYENNQVNLERYRVVEGLVANNVYPNLNLLAADDTMATDVFYLQAAYDYAQTWLQQFEGEVNCIYSTWDGEGESVAEAIKQAGDPNGDEVFVFGIEGGSLAWKYIRDDTPLKYTYSQPFELYTHNLFEVIAQLQQEGLNPGDEGCDIEQEGDIIYASGVITTMENVPDIGVSVHAVFDYYGGEPEDPEAWYNWTDGPGIYYVTDGSEAESVTDQIEQ